MLERLEAADRATELDAVLAVVHRHLHAALGGTDLLGGQRDDRDGADLLERRGRVVGGEPHGRGGVEFHQRHRAGEVHRRQLTARDAAGRRVDLEQTDDAVRAFHGRGHDEHVGVRAVEHVVRGARHGVAVGVAAGGRARDVVTAPVALGAHPAECRDGRALRDARQQALARLVVAGRQDRLGGEDRGAEHRRRRQRGAEFLEHQVLLDEGRAEPAELLGDRERRDTDLLAQHVPQAAVERLARLERLAQRGRVGALGQQLGNRLAEFDLLLREHSDPAHSALAIRARWAEAVPHADCRARVLVSHSDRSHSRV